MQAQTFSAFWNMNFGFVYFYVGNMCFSFTFNMIWQKLTIYSWTDYFDFTYKDKLNFILMTTGHCQAQPQAQLNWAELALISVPAGCPP